MLPFDLPEIVYFLNSMLKSILPHIPSPLNYTAAQLNVIYNMYGGFVTPCTEIAISVHR